VHAYQKYVSDQISDEMNMNKYLEEKLLPFIYLAKDADHNLRLKGCELFAQMFEMGMIPTLEAAKSFVMM